MKYGWLVLGLMMSGCLAQYDPFNEEDFLDAYIDVVCPMIQDCTDGVADNAWSSEMDGVAQECAAYARSSMEKSCAIRSEYALTCFAEAQAAQSTVYEQDNCASLDSWLDTGTNNCSLVYVNCVTDTPFGSYAVSTDGEDEN